MLENFSIKNLIFYWSFNEKNHIDHKYDSTGQLYWYLRPKIIFSFVDCESWFDFEQEWLQ